MGTDVNARMRWREAAGSFTSAMRSAPELSFLLALFILVAISAKRTGALPGSGMSLLGDAAVAVSCAFLYACLGIVYIKASPREEWPERPLLRRIGLCLVLAVISTYGLMRVTAPAVWDKVFYLRLFAPPAFAGLWCMALLPRATGELFRVADASRAAAPLRPLAVLLASAAFLVTCSDLALQFGDASGTGIRGSVLQKDAWLANIAILFAAFALIFAVTLRVATALLLVAPLYVVLGLSTIAKLKYIHSPVVPLDLLSVREFLPFFRAFFGNGVFAAAACGLIAWIVSLLATLRTCPRRITLLSRGSIGVFSLILLLAFPVLETVSPQMELNRRIGAPEVWKTDQRESTRTSGFLLSFLSEIPASFIAAPTGYSPETVAAASRKYPEHAVAPTGRDSGRRVNLIVYMVESLMDPEDLGWRFSSDPIPNLRALLKNGTGGNCIVPMEYCGSSDSEFEALTGMTVFFLPERSVAYRQFIQNPMPSLPAALKRLGYRTFAVQADPRNFYNREQVYGLLGFEEVFWLNGAPGVERAPKRFWPSDNAIVGTIIEASRGKRPFFAFAFPSSTHSPYNSGVYGNSDLDVLDPLPGGASGEVKEYISALRDADRAIGRLIGHFRGRPEPTMIVVLGDHLPPLSEEAYRSFNRKLPGLSLAEREWKIRSVPLLVWTNYDLPREKVRMGMNALPSYLLERIGIAPRGFLAVTNQVRLKLPVLSGNHILGADGSVWNPDSIPRDEKLLVDDYRMLQYDLLIGKRYSLQGSAVASKPDRVSDARRRRSSSPARSPR